MSPTPASPVDRGAGPMPAATAMPAAVQRALMSLQSSRQALRTEMLPPPAAGGEGSPGGLDWRRWWRRLRRWPASRLAREAAQHWWQRQPLHHLGDTLIGEARQQLWPLVRRHPWVSIGVAVAAGVGIATLRPWRWQWLDAHVRQLPRTAGRWLWQQATSAPMQAALTSLLVMATSKVTAQASGQQVEHDDIRPDPVLMAELRQQTGTPATAHHPSRPGQDS